MSEVISVNPYIQGGTPSFAGTRVPIACFFDALDHHRSIDYFLQQYPSVERDQVIGLLDEARAKLIPETASS